MTTDFTSTPQWAEALDIAHNTPVITQSLLSFAADAEYADYLQNIINVGIRRDEICDEILRNWSAPILMQDPEKIQRDLDHANATPWPIKHVKLASLRKELQGCNPNLKTEQIPEIIAQLRDYKAACREIDENRHDLESAFAHLATPAHEQWQQMALTLTNVIKIITLTASAPTHRQQLISH